jgi:hypothetical protein
LGVLIELSGERCDRRAVLRVPAITDFAILVRAALQFALPNYARTGASLPRAPCRISPTNRLPLFATSEAQSSIMWGR